MVDLDGSFEHSRIIAVVNDAARVSFELLGNPASGREIRFLLKNEDPSRIQLFDLSGKSLKFLLLRSGNEFTIRPKNALASGLYVISL
jgi:hypothetical protein